jgi:hypothetical protein
MSLPKVVHPTFKITIPSTKKALTFRPYTVREEKILLMMKESESIPDVVDALRQVIINCCMEDIDVSKLALFDIEYIFVKIRAKSVGEILELQLNEGEKPIKFTVNLDDVEIKFNPTHTNKIMLFDQYGVTMKYPTFDVMLKLDTFIKENKDTKKINEFIFDVIISCIDNVFDDEKVYKDFTKEELDNFVLSLPVEASNKLREFFDTMPSLEHTVTLKNKEGETKDITLRGLKDFFIF